MENPTEKLIENLLSVYLNAKPGEPLDLYAQSLLDQLVGPNSGENQKSTIKLFKQKLLDFENGNRNSAEYVKKVIVLTYYMFDIHNMDGRFFKYSASAPFFSSSTMRIPSLEDWLEISTMSVVFFVSAKAAASFRNFPILAPSMV